MKLDSPTILEIGLLYRILRFPIDSDIYSLLSTFAKTFYSSYFLPSSPVWNRTHINIKWGNSKNVRKSKVSIELNFKLYIENFMTLYLLFYLQKKTFCPRFTLSIEYAFIRNVSKTSNGWNSRRYSPKLINLLYEDWVEYRDFKCRRTRPFLMLKLVCLLF